MPPGSNHILTAKIKGAAVREAWLMRADDLTTRVPMARVSRATFEINLAARSIGGILNHNADAQDVQVVAFLRDGRRIASTVICAKSSLPMLNLGDADATMNVRQRCWMEIPGSRGSLVLHIGDISGGRVLAAILDARREPILAWRPVREGDELTLNVTGGRYAVFCERLVNLLAGDDYGVFIVCKAEALEKRRIAWLIAKIDECEVTFIRDDRELTGRQFRSLLEQMHAPSERLEDFIERIGSRSGRTGKPYQVRLSDGTLIDVGIWLREQAGLRTTAIELPTTRQAE